MVFCQHCWNVVKNEVLGFSREFNIQGTFARSSPATFLILKHPLPLKDLKDLKLISLMGSLYILLTKINSENNVKYPKCFYARERNLYILLTETNSENNVKYLKCFYARERSVERSSNCEMWPQIQDHETKERK